MKIAESVLLKLFVRYNENCIISHAPSTGLGGIQYSILNVLQIGLNVVTDPEGPEKNIRTLR